MSLDQARAANLAENPYAGQGAVLLDVGDDVGAIVLHLGASHEGLEVEIERLDRQSSTHQHHHGVGQSGQPHDHSHRHRPHVAVVGRPCGAGRDYSAVFPDLAAGSYRLSIPGDSQTVTAEVSGGAVTELAWADRLREGA